MRIGIFFIFIGLIIVESGFAKTFILGDSLSCGSFGKELFKQFEKIDSQVVLVCAVSSRPEHWVRSENPSGFICKTLTSDDSQYKPCGDKGEMPSLSSLIKEANNSKVIIALGTNSLGVQKIDDNYMKLASALSANSQSCQWVGPPHLDPNHVSLSAPRRNQIAKMEAYLDTFYLELESGVGKKCKVIDSRLATKAGTLGNGTIDGIHKKESAGKKWAQDVFPQLF